MSSRKSATRTTGPQPKPSLAERAASLKEGLTRPRARRAKTAPAAIRVPSDLAEACDHAIEHWRGIQPAAQAEDWDDDRLDAAMSVYDTTFRRAIDEPSRCVADLQAKARLLLHDLREHGSGHDPDDEATFPDDERLVRVVLREVAALDPGTAAQAVGGLLADLHAMSGGVHHDDGTVSFCDAAGRVLHKTTAEWIGFTAMRMHHQVRVETARQVNDPALTDTERTALALQLRRDLRADAVFALARRPGEAFDAALAEDRGTPPPPVGPPRHYQPEAVSPDLRAAIEAHREARQLIIHDPVDDDARLAAADDRLQKLGDVVRAMPVRSIADLRWKMIYLWPGSLDGEVNDHELRDTFSAFREDVQHLSARLDPQEPEETDKQAQARLAAMPFVPSDIDGPCPVPSKARWIEDAKSTLVWLRFGFVVLCSDREKLTGILRDQDEEQFREMQDALGIAYRNFTQMSAVAQQALSRIQIGLAILAEDEDRAADGG